jgi:ribosomal protein S18 acetylase RimI-like enzyme
MNIRPALPSDARAIADLHVRTWQSTYRGIVPDAYLDALSVDERATLLRDSITRGSPEIWVASCESMITGWIAFGPSRDPDGKPMVGEIEAVYVSPEHWSTGTGRELWNIARARLVERGFASVTLWVLEQNERATRFYRAAGFMADTASRKEISIGGKNVWEVRYACALRMSA